MTPEGIEVRHRKSCASHDGRRCACAPSYRASVWSPRDGRRIRRSFPSLAEARRWRAGAYRDVQAGALSGPKPLTLNTAAATLLAGMETGAVRTRGGDAYKPSVTRSYEAALRRRVLPDLGGARLGAITRPDVQRIVDEMLAGGAHPSTIRNAVMPLRVIFRRAVEDGVVPHSPCANLRMPAVRSQRERIASPEEAARLLEVLPPGIRPLYATALYSGLRRGELRGLLWSDVDLQARRIRVRRAMDDGGTIIAPKSRAGTRDVPICRVLADQLEEHLTGESDPSPSRYVFGGRSPFTPSAARRRAATAWRHAGLTPIGLHECRHTFASLLIAAGLNAKAVTTFMGHSSIQVTFDLYGKLLPGSEGEMVERLDALLDAALSPAVSPEASTAHG